VRCRYGRSKAGVGTWGTAPAASRAQGIPAGSRCSTGYGSRIVTLLVLGVPAQAPRLPCVNLTVVVLKTAPKGGCMRGQPAAGKHYTWCPLRRLPGRQLTGAPAESDSGHLPVSGLRRSQTPVIFRCRGSGRQVGCRARPAHGPRAGRLAAAILEPAGAYIGALRRGTGGRIGLEAHEGGCRPLTLRTCLAPPLSERVRPCFPCKG
jgi:hypothetical protein